MDLGLQGARDAFLSQPPQTLRLGHFRGHCREQEAGQLEGEGALPCPWGHPSCPQAGFQELSSGLQSPKRAGRQCVLSQREAEGWALGTAVLYCRLVADGTRWGGLPVSPTWQ